MKNFIISGVVLFAALSATVPASAEWTYVISNLESKLNFYIDLATLRKDSNIRKVWVMTDYPTMGDFGERSVVRREEHDCYREQYRVISARYQQDHFGKGKLIKSFEEIGPWSNAAPGTVADHYVKLICGK